MSGWDDLNGWDAVTVRPISSWPDGEAPIEWRPSPFDAPWHATTEVLARELRMLDARQVVLELAIGESEIRLDGKPYARARARHPGVILSFESRHGPLRYATGAFDSWQANLRAVALGLEALRKVDRYGIARRGEQYRGWRQLHSGADDESTIERGRRIIAGADGDVREALKATHPDRGGNPVDFRSVQLARDAG